MSKEESSYNIPKNRIYEIRYTNGYTQEEFGQLIGAKMEREQPYWPTAVSKWENNSVNVPVVYAISQLFSVSADYVLGFDTGNKCYKQVSKEEIYDYDSLPIIYPSGNINNYIGIINCEKRIIEYKNNVSVTFDRLPDSIFLVDGIVKPLSIGNLKYYYSKPVTIIDGNSITKDAYYRKTDKEYMTDSKKTYELREYGKNWIALEN